MPFSHYRQHVGFLMRDCNKVFPLPHYFHDMVYKHGTYKIADLGAGPVCTLGGKFAGSDIQIYASDIYADAYKKLTDEVTARTGEPLLISIEYQDIENLTYPDEFFDIVHCVNTLDHVRDIKKAISEMKRVCKPGGWIYLRHAPNQKAHLGGDHYWNCTMEGFSNGKELVTMDGFFTGTDSFMITHVMRK